MKNGNAYEVNMRTCTHHNDSERVAARMWEHKPGCPVCAMNQKEAPSDKVEVLGQKSLSVILDEMEQRANAATPGPWKAALGFTRHESAKVSGPSQIESIANLRPRLTPGGTFLHNRDSTFIAAARSDVPALVKALRHAHLIFRHANDEESISDLAKLLSEPAGSVPSGNKKDL